MELNHCKKFRFCFSFPFPHFSEKEATSLTSKGTSKTFLLYSQQVFKAIENTSNFITLETKSFFSARNSSHFKIQFYNRMILATMRGKNIFFKVLDTRIRVTGSALGETDGLSHSLINIIYSGMASCTIRWDGRAM